MVPNVFSGGSDWACLCSCFAIVLPLSIWNGLLSSLQSVCQVSVQTSLVNVCDLILLQGPEVLRGFLAHVSLNPTQQAKQGEDGLWISTIHAAKVTVHGSDPRVYVCLVTVCSCFKGLP